MRPILVARRLATAAACAALAFSADSGTQAIDAMKAYQRSLGLSPGGNFRKHTSRTVAEYRCYYANKLELPASYDELRIRTGSENGCPGNPAKDDVFFYPVQAVASGKTPVTSSLAAAPAERRLMVVMHEDFHQQHEVSRLPAAVTEAASTLLGFVAASGFAAEQPQHGSGAALVRDAELFLNKSRMINRYFDEAAALYGARKARRLTAEAALDRKVQLFERLSQECRAMLQQAVSFNACPGALNNAGLAFDYTYTRHYPLLWSLFEAERRDVRATLTAVREILALPLRREAEFVKAVGARIAAIHEAGVN